MKATFKELNHAPKFNINHRKENHFNSQYTAVVFNGRSSYDAVTLRIYSTGVKCYCCIWITDNCSWVKEARELHYRNGSGSVDGGGSYHMPSAAAQEAIYNAGIELDEHIDGRGDSAIEEAVYSIAAAMWSGEGYHIHITKANP